MMRGTKFWLTIFVAAMLVFVTFTPARADTPLPQGLNGEEPDLSNSTVVANDYVPPEDLVLADITAPYPLYPINSIITFNRVPKLYFARNDLATAYKIYMYDARTTSTLLYTFVGGTENCGTGYCWLKPPTKLKTLKYDETSGGFYGWRVSAKINGSWVHNVNYGFFNLLSKGFTSTFDLNTRGWEVLNGTWKRTPAGQYKTNGIPYTYVNAWNKEYFVENMVIEVRMKRKVEIGSFSQIYFFGYPTPFWGGNRWDDGYNFYYFNNGNWTIYKYTNGGSALLTSGITAYDEPLDWNTFKFWLHDGRIYIWVNGIFIMSLIDSSPLTYGAVGLAMYEGDPDLSPLLVDYVKVYYSGSVPDAIPQEEIALDAPELE